MVCSIGEYLMVKKLNKLCFGKLLAIATIALSCVFMWGCGEDKVSFDWGKYRSDESIAGFIDDSLGKTANDAIEKALSEYEEVKSIIDGIKGELKNEER